MNEFKTFGGYPVKDAGARELIETLQNDLATANGTITTLQGDLANANETIETLQTNLSNANGTIETLQSDLTNANGNIETLQNDLQTANGKISDLETENEELNSKIETEIISYADGTATYYKSGNVRVLNFDYCTIQNLVALNIPSDELPTKRAVGHVIMQQDGGNDYIGVVFISKENKAGAYVMTYGDKLIVLNSESAYKILGQLSWCVE